MNPALVTGLVLAGGEGRRMGGLDKGLQDFAGQPLALHALRRLAPQVGRTAVSANRHLDAYAAFGVPVLPDDEPCLLPPFPGPLGGFLAGLQACETPWLVTVPCDTPRFPSDLVARLAQAVEASDGEVAVAATRDGDSLRLQPAFCLMRTGVKDSLRQYLQSGERRISRWIAQQRGVEVVFDTPDDFANANTLDDLDQLRPHRRP